MREFDDATHAALAAIRAAERLDWFPGVPMPPGAFDPRAVSPGALRDLNGMHPAQWANLVGYYVVGLPVAGLLAFRYHLGAVGLWWGLSLGLAIVAVTLVHRFERRSRGSVARVA